VVIDLAIVAAEFTFMFVGFCLGLRNFRLQSLNDDLIGTPSGQAENR
jgi:hypothetical protein